MPKILIVDDEEAVRFGLTEYLKSLDFSISGVDTLAKARERIREGNLAVVLLDVNLPDGDGISFIDEIREMDSELPIILFTGYGTIPMAVKAMKKGCDHFLTKPVDLSELEVLIDKAVQLGNLRAENKALKSKPNTIEPFLGSSAAIEEVMILVEAAVKHSSPVLLRGETGTGKGMISRLIHSRSQHSRHSFVELNCAGLKGEFLESELFGHTKGAFTGAIDKKQGLLEKAHRGTLFLDEIGDMDLQVQSKFLKVLEEKRFRPLGKVEEKISDFRLISATHQNLEDLMDKGLFRKDLFFRINTLTIRMPSLRERMEDLEELSFHLLAFITGRRTTPVIDKEVFDVFRSYSWPGNIRELHNVLERAWMLSEGVKLDAKDLKKSGFKSINRKPSSENRSETIDLKGAERKHIEDTLEKTGGNVNEAAHILGVSRATLYRKISSLGVKTP